MAGTGHKPTPLPVMGGRAARLAATLDGDGWALVARYSPLADRVARSATPGHRRGGDLLANAAFDGLIEAVATFDPSRGLSLPIYIAWTATRRVRFRRCRKAYREATGDARLRADDGDGRDDALCVQGPGPSDLALVDLLLGSLPPRLAAATRLVVLDGLTHVEAARAIGMSKSWVAMAVARSLAILRSHPAARRLAAEADWTPP